MQSLHTIKSLLESHGLRPNKSLGQNFLIEPAHVRRLVDAAELAPDDLILEVGPGTGVLTDLLLERGCRVIACELDRGLAALLRERLAEPIAAGRLTLIEGDCLASKHEFNPTLTAALAGRPFKLVANLPYAAASPLIIILATQWTAGATASGASLRAQSAVAGAHEARFAPCLGQFVTIQREVADRLRAKPGTRDFGEMGVLVQSTCIVERLAILPPGCFWPPPRVESEMVAIRPRAAPLTNDPARLEALCRLLFTQRRKQLGAVLAKSCPHMLAALPPGVTPIMRAEQLTVEQLIQLAASMT